MLHSPDIEGDTNLNGPAHLPLMQLPNASSQINTKGMHRQRGRTVLTCESSSATPLSSAWWWLLLAVPSISAAMRAASCAEMRAFLKQAGDIGQLTRQSAGTCTDTKTSLQAVTGKRHVDCRLACRQSPHLGSSLVVYRSSLKELCTPNICWLVANWSQVAPPDALLR